MVLQVATAAIALLAGTATATFRQEPLEVDSAATKLKTAIDWKTVQKLDSLPQNDPENVEYINSMAPAVICGSDGSFWSAHSCVDFYNSLPEAPIHPENITPAAKEVGVVVAHYQEDLSWIDSYFSDSKFKVYVYSKGGVVPQFNKTAKKVALNNIGRDGETFLRHLSENYDRLEPNMLFVPGSGPLLRGKSRVLDVVMEDLRKGIRNGFTPRTMVYSCGEEVEMLDDFYVDYYCAQYIDSNDPDMAEKCHVDLSPYKTYGKFRKHFLGGKTYDCPRLVAMKGVFATTKENIRRRDVAMYKELLGLMQLPNPETGHYLERFWAELFSDPLSEEEKENPEINQPGVTHPWEENDHDKAQHTSPDADL